MKIANRVNKNQLKVNEKGKELKREMHFMFHHNVILIVPHPNEVKWADMMREQQLGQPDSRGFYCFTATWPAELTDSLFVDSTHIFLRKI